MNEFWEITENIPPFIASGFTDVAYYCKKHLDCTGCVFRLKHKGCYWRLGKTPREWGNINDNYDTTGMDER